MARHLFAQLLLALLPQGESVPHDPFARFVLPQEWQSRFWSNPGLVGLLDRSPSEIAAMVPKQAGFRFVRCPACGAPDLEEPLVWNVADPDHLTCRRCQVVLPNDAFPAHPDGDKNKPIPAEVVEVLPGVKHEYPYHAVPQAEARYPGERVYLQARRDHQARAQLSKAALYAAVAFREGGPAPAGDPRLARLSAAVLVTFARAYPAYATHYDQPGEPKFVQSANLLPPYRLGFRTGKWDWSGALNVPLDLVVAYGILRGNPEIEKVGQELGQTDAGRLIEESLIRPSAEFVLGHPDPNGELSIHAARGLLAAGRLLEDQALVDAGLRMLEGVARKAFHYDGTWREVDPVAQQRVLGLLDGWFQELVHETRPGAPGLAAGGRSLSILELARQATPRPLEGETGNAAGVRQASFDLRTPGRPAAPLVMGGAGLVRLATGRGAEALELEVSDRADPGQMLSDRMAVRLSVAGKLMLGAPEDEAPRTDGWERSSVAHDVVLVDGLNQREEQEIARQSSEAGEILFHAADPAFQVVTVSDPWAYPRSCRLYRQTVVVVADEETGIRYGLRLFEVEGGRQHDQIFHEGPGGTGWRLDLPTVAGPSSLMPPSVVYLPKAKREDGRWFVQSYGALSHLSRSEPSGPFFAESRLGDGTGVRVHFLDVRPSTAFLATSPRAEGTGRRDALVVRIRSEDGEPLNSRLLTLFEPIEPASGLERAGRIDAGEGVVAVALETVAGPEYLVVNLAPGTTRDVLLPDASTLRTDGLVVRCVGESIWLAGGTFAERNGIAARQLRASGTIVGATPSTDEPGTGWFLADGMIPEPDACEGRTLIIRHGDGRSRAWTIRRIEPAPGERWAIHVEEEPAFDIDAATGRAVEYQYPCGSHPGPHEFRIGRIARGRPGR